MIECLVFDLDDTLYPERQYVLPRLEAVARYLEDRFGAAFDFRGELVKCYESNMTGKVFDTVLSRAGLCADKTFVDELVELYRSGESTLSPYPDVRAALGFWQERMDLGLVTDGNRETQRKKIEALQISGYFRETIFTAELGLQAAKPSPKAFRLLQEKIGFEGSAMYVGDNPELDVPGCRQLGWTATRIIRPNARFAQLPAPPSCQPDYSIWGLDELGHLKGLKEYI